MSQFLIPQAAGLRINLLCPDTHSIRSPLDTWNDGGRGPQVRPWSPGLLFTMPRYMPGDLDVPLEPWRDNNDFDEMIYNTDWGGAPGMLKIRGTTRDSSGNPLGNCIVQGFRTSDDLYVGEVTSDSAGYFELPTPYSGTNHYLLAYKAGSPDIAGSTVNTLQPS